MVGAQRTGLKYFEDFKQRIPRVEVAAVAAVVHEAVEEVLQCSRAPDADMLFCCALGRCVPVTPLMGHSLSRQLLANVCGFCCDT